MTKASIRPLFLILIVFLTSNATLLKAWGIPAKKPVKKSSDQRYHDYGDLILDTKTNLMWFKLDFWQLEKEHLNWYQAVEYIQKINNKKFYGYSDWRFPTPEEATTLYERRKRNSDKDGDKMFIDRIFPKGAGWATWTGTNENREAVKFGTISALNLRKAFLMSPVDYYLIFYKFAFAKF